MVAVGLLDHPFKERYASRIGELPGADTPWIEGMRRTARDVLYEIGLPGPKNEAWKFTPLADLSKIAFMPAPIQSNVLRVPDHVYRIPGARRIVLVNGVLNVALSDSIDDLRGLQLEGLGTALSSGAASLRPLLGGLAVSTSSPMVALNTAYMSGGVVLTVNQNFSGPALHIVSIGSASTDPIAFHPRVVIALDQSAKLTLVESHLGAPGHTYFTNPVTEISVGEKAHLWRYVAVTEEDTAFHLATTAVSVARDGQFESFHIGLGGVKVRQEVRIRIEEPGVSVKLNGVYALAGRQHHDFTTSIHHTVPHGTSSQLFKGVVDDQSHAVFQGHIHVAKDAQKTDARLLHKALFLDKGPAVDCKPELEIFADDVQCAHGAATGEIDQDQLFYLMARGIDRDAARALLVAGFLDDALQIISDEAAREAFSTMAHNWLQGRAFRRAA